MAVIDRGVDGIASITNTSNLNRVAPVLAVNRMIPVSIARVLQPLATMTVRSQSLKLVRRETTLVMWVDASELTRTRSRGSPAWKAKEFPTVSPSYRSPIAANVHTSLSKARLSESFLF
ncbi:hypothetical protein, variant 3 [Aphanomyces invadans]|uniref:Uncharacterized protein n=1 Tax=Aphanomyces invadans TaxID=157072 RepID=A0A024U2K1_9STRA|nr:hypothetical protein, variant 2 [Aphanomyces invadans]XP_008870556.1 hypothetical protein, variant 3 [Aphanomyces invadans]ETW00420.1 hypothetical protein, variant 2 [Aphanomyces invadans]ETW00421.1 hypothetical protein, variant 3 [Aphanomyces invadans]|eukprot:XP_008870555.1 hypothetical protein, variant 2 [Aphanomyces invadans]